MTLNLAFADDAGNDYATHKNAVRAFETACAKVGITEMKYLVCARSTGRFFPVALPREDQVQDAIWLAHKGVACVRT
jgi:hypothetical protein